MPQRARRSDAGRRLHAIMTLVPEDSLMRPVFLMATVMALSVAPATNVRADAATVATPARLAIHAARMLDVESGRMVADPLVLVEGDRIVSVTAEGRRPAGAQLVELATRRCCQA
jgi:hypothetical protein